ncbi:hypothetical protein DM01DRAFT_1398566 [Hesseltinella vesiculosa]|uniref:Yeast cell wall synthesis Kre9/Knh1-like N-terminal domain-containing protein n=1 Tax=Hesseltinella vesiculosa TaxID=101127 RepID=A0A1X2G4H9_9FUNG|nr:hypothetical protein DM01DRAFT_1398566 [Hesseltinella vesiculosa]
MKAFTSLVFLSAALLAMVQAVPVVKRGQPLVKITSPAEGTSLKQNEQATLTWQVQPSDQTKAGGPTELTVQLLRGDPNHLEFIRTLNEHIDMGSGSAQITIPKEIEDGNNYAFAIGSTPEDLNYIGRINISGGAVADPAIAGESADTGASADAGNTAAGTEAATGTENAASTPDGAPDAGQQEIKSAAPASVMDRQKPAIM